MTINAARALLADTVAVRALLAPPASWCQFRDYRIETAEDGIVHYRRCLQGAVMTVTRPMFVSTPRYLAVCRLLAYVIGPDPHTSLVQWNDDRARTHDEIRALLDAAVTEARRRLHDADDAPSGDRAIVRDEELAHV